MKKIYFNLLNFPQFHQIAITMCCMAHGAPSALCTPISRGSGAYPLYKLSGGPNLCSSESAFCTCDTMQFYSVLSILTIIVTAVTAQVLVYIGDSCSQEGSYGCCYLHKLPSTCTCVHKKWVLVPDDLAESDAFPAEYPAPFCPD